MFRPLALGLVTASLTASAQAPSSEADAHFARGVEALKAKDAPAAARHLAACVAAAPSRVDCRWELGWAHYVSQDWAGVVAQWEEVKRLSPTHPEVDARLVEARGQLELRRKLDALPETAPVVRKAPPPEVSLRLRAVGDLMIGTDFPEGYLPPEDGATVLAGVHDWLRDADLTFVNLEGPLCDDPAPSAKCRPNSTACYAFRSPTRYVKYLVEAGVDLASTANNHSGDFGEACRRETEATLDKVGIKWSGAPGTIATVEKNGLRVAMIGFHTSPATNDVNDHATAAKLVKSARANHDLVIVSFHGGAEGSGATRVPKGREVFHGENRGDLRAFARTVVDAGADLVLGHGPHVLRAMEIYKDRLIAYSLGNFATYGRFNLSGPLGIGVILEVVLDGEGKFVSGKLLPTRQIEKGLAVKDPEGTALKQVRLLSEEDFPDTGVRVDSDGNIGPREAPKKPGKPGKK
jgi:hypothetical protein